jgi:MFS family permease
MRGLPAVIALRSIAAAAFFGTEVFLPLLLSRERGLSPTLAGLVLTFGALGWSAGSWYRGRMRDPAPVAVLRIGLGLVAAGVCGVAAATWPATPVALAMAGWVLAGFGMGTSFPTLSVLVLQLSPPELQGSHSSALQVAGSLFTAAILTLSGVLFAALLDHAPSAAYLTGFAITAALAMLGTALADRVRIV